MKRKIKRFRIIYLWCPNCEHDWLETIKAVLEDLAQCPYCDSRFTLNSFGMKE